MSQQLSDGVSPAVRTGQLFLVSLVGLYLELLLIRWLGTEVRIFAYLQNIILVVCFLGLGMGCWTCRQEFQPRQLLVPLFLLVLVLAIPATRNGLRLISELLRIFGGSGGWLQAFLAEPGKTALLALLGLGMMFILLTLIWDLMVPVGRLLGRLMDEHPRTIVAYSVNVAGSLIGVWLFVAMSVLYQPPAVWVTVAAALLLPLLWWSGKPKPADLSLLAGVVALSFVASHEPGALEIWWSPYQKLSLRPPLKEGFEGIGEHIIWVNNGSYQGMLNLDPQHVREHPDRYPPDQAGLSQYDVPALLHPRPQKVLLVGAGSGNDAAGMVRQRVPDITAVDIDPAIIQMGKRLHPEKPYDAAGVHAVVDDARSFFATTAERYDLVVFCLLDSHASTAMTNARLDHYVYTRESLQRARELLAPGGVLTLTFEVTEPFMAERFLVTLRDLFGHDPIHFRIPPSGYGWGGVMFVAADDQTPVEAQIAANPRLARKVAEWQAEYPVIVTGLVPPATDDWPFIYLHSAQVPPLFFILVAVLGLLFARNVRRLGAPGLLRGWDRSSWHFFFMGAAFLLLEVQNISKASVVLGSTWEVNAVIISSILALVLAANLIVALAPRLPAVPVYALLCGTCLALYFIDLSRFAFLPYATKAVVVGLLTSLPMLFSGIVFIRSFAATPRKDLALGANLFGALVGGLLQPVTFLIGVKALLLIVAGLYVAALWTLPRAATAAESPAESPEAPAAVT